MSELIEFQEETNYCFIRMDDGKANALSFEMLQQLNAALDQAQETGKVVVILGRPGKFSAGFDLSVMGQGGEAMIELLSTGANLARRLLNFETPVVLGVSGHALAMGALLLLSADYRIGGEGAYKIGLNEAAIGMTLPWFGVELARYRLSGSHFNSAVGLARIYDPAGAVEAGYLDECVAEDALSARAIALAEQLAGLDMEAHKQSKARVREELNAALERALEKDFGA